VFCEGGGTRSVVAMISQRRALAAALTLIIMTSNSTATSAVFVAYRTHWGLTAADIGVAFAVYFKEPERPLELARFQRHLRRAIGDGLRPVKRWQ
jgi:hypothetical protein